MFPTVINFFIITFVSNVTAGSIGRVQLVVLPGGVELPPGGQSSVILSRWQVHMFSHSYHYDLNQYLSPYQNLSPTVA